MSVCSRHGKLNLPPQTSPSKGYFSQQPVKATITPRWEGGDRKLATSTVTSQKIEQVGIGDWYASTLNRLVGE
ncbi:hypothetical protein HOLleu_01592 [Holothuria leucospilota]|uniref:Uncharacterized protein n=1 Tax=Holothuria leucospilota TaxID=206669 RepID=A0A9Q1CQ63_HOLLE|nr:hypothetical protein HOLleu_01592 [Holothuria leucospilota]